jgi:hypothetical protein
MDGKQQSPVSAGDTATSKARERDRREGIELGTAEEPSSVTQSDLTSLSATLEHEKIAVLANRYWHERGCPEGSAEEDWFRAEQKIRNEFEVGPRFDRAPLRLTH